MFVQTSDGWLLGKTKVFVRDRLMAGLEQARRVALAERALVSFFFFFVIIIEIICISLNLFFLKGFASVVAWIASSTTIFTTTSSEIV